MLNLTKEECLLKFRKQWNWIANETLRLKRKVYKHEFFEFMNISECDIPRDECYCCEYDAMFNGDCEHCLVDWKSDANTRIGIIGNTCFNSKGLYKKWLCVDNGNYKEASRLAREIANLPER